MQAASLAAADSPALAWDAAGRPRTTPRGLKSLSTMVHSLCGLISNFAPSPLGGPCSTLLSDAAYRDGRLVRWKNYTEMPSARLHAQSVPITDPLEPKRLRLDHKDPDFVLESWSEWQDLNLRPPRPERGEPTGQDGHPPGAPN